MILDKIGITAASLCALHCMLLPVVFPALPLLGLSFLADHAWEHVFLLVTAVMGAFAILSGFKRYHKRLYPLYLLLVGVVIYWVKHDFSESLQPYFIFVGASLIVAAHLINIKLCNSCKQCQQEVCNPS